MADRGIIFSAPMVRALLDGRKTQTRRLAKFVQPDGDGWHLRGNGGGLFGADDDAVQSTGADYAPYAAGDRLYVRESALYWIRSNDNQRDKVAAFKADGYELEDGERWTPSIHMPRKFSRLWLAVTEVRVQRLQECSEADAKAEGLGAYPMEGPAGLWIDCWHWQSGVEPEDTFSSPVGAYRALWNSLHTAEGERWEDNPWVVAVSFDVHRGNIDAVAA